MTICFIQYVEKNHIYIWQLNPLRAEVNASFVSWLTEYIRTRIEDENVMLRHE